MTRYAHNVLAGASHLLNAILGGHPRYSFSARVGKAAHDGKAWGKIVAPLIDALLFSRSHCEEQAREAGLIP